jgi:hypothetical protein
VSLSDAEPNVLHVVDEDTVYLRYDSTPENQFQIPKQLEARAQQGRYYLIIDVSKSPRLTRGASEDGPSMVNSSWFLGVVFVNASGLMKMGLKVFHLGMHLTGQKDFPTAFVKTLDEGRIAVAELRAKNAAKA